MANLNLYTIVNQNKIVIDAELLQEKVLSTINCKNNRIAFYCVNDEYHLSTETKAKERKVSYETDLAKLSYLFCPKNRSHEIFNAEREILGSFEISHAIAAAKLFKFIQQKIVKQNERLDGLYKGKFVQFLLKIPVICRCFQAYFYKANPVSEMVERSIKACFISGKEHIANFTQNLDIKVLISENNDSSKSWEGVFQTFEDFQAILPYKIDCSNLSRAFIHKNTLEAAHETFNRISKLINKAKDNQVIVLDPVRRLNYNLDSNEWKEINEKLELAYHARLRACIPQLKDAKAIIDGDLESVSVEQETFEYWEIFRDCLIKGIELDRKVVEKLPLVIQKELIDARNIIDTEYAKWQAIRIRNLENKSLPDTVFGTNNFKDNQQRFRALKELWKNNEKYADSLLLVKDSYRTVLGSQMLQYSSLKKDPSFKIPSSFSSASNFEDLKKEYENFKGLIEDYKHVKQFEVCHNPEELEVLLEASYIVSKERLFPELKEMNDLRRNLEQAKLENKEVPEALFESVLNPDNQRKKLQELYRLISEASKVFNKGEKGLAVFSKEKYPPEILADFKKLFEESCNDFSSIYVNYIIKNLSKINGQSKGAFLTACKTAINKAKANYGEIEVRYKALESQFALALFEQRDLGSEKDRKLSFLKDNIFPHMSNALKGMLSKKNASFERIKRILELQQNKQSVKPKSLIELLDPKKVTFGNMVILEEKKNALTKLIDEELAELDENDIKLKTELNTLKDSIEHEWNDLLKQKYSQVFRYINVQINTDLVRNFFKDPSNKKMIDLKLNSIRKSMSDYKAEILPESIQTKITYIETLCIVAEELLLAEKICTLEKFEEESTKKILKAKMHDYETKSEEERRKAYVAIQYGLAVEAKDEELRKRYQSLSMKFHPDKQNYPSFVCKSVISTLQNKFKELPKVSFYQS